jgi:hypothetical protein
LYDEKSKKCASIFGLKRERTTGELGELLFTLLSAIVGVTKLHASRSQKNRAPLQYEEQSPDE